MRASAHVLDIARLRSAIDDEGDCFRSPGLRRAYRLTLLAPLGYDPCA
jgi:hypothetical protein